MNNKTADLEIVKEAVDVARASAGLAALHPSSSEVTLTPDNDVAGIETARQVFVQKDNVGQVELGRGRADHEFLIGRQSG